LSLAKGGPVTQEGKEVAKWNAVKHGLRSPAPVIPGIERKEDWEEHRDGVLESLQPEGHLETVLAERVALLSWRLHRVIRFETESIALYQEKTEDDLARERRFESGPDHPEAVRGNAKSDRDDHRLLKRFAKMEEDKRLSSFDADLVIWGAMECADKVAEGEVEPGEVGLIPCNLLQARLVRQEALPSHVPKIPLYLLGLELGSFGLPIGASYGSFQQLLRLFVGGLGDGLYDRTHQPGGPTLVTFPGVAVWKTRYGDAL
jgi:hypothetical protein